MKRTQTARAGTVLMEFVMAFPIVLTLMLAIVQFAHIMIARQVVHYAAYSAARVALVVKMDEEKGIAEKAAVRVCSAITLSESIEEFTRRDQADGGDMEAFDAARRKTRTDVNFELSTWNVTATVKHDFALVVPIVGQMLGWGLSLWEGPSGYELHPDDTGDAHVGDDAIDYPHIQLTGTVKMPKPYLTLVAADYDD